MTTRGRIVALGLAASLLSPAGAIAHSGGRAQLYVAAATIAPQGDGWAISTMLRDLDSGAPEPGFAVEFSGRGPAGAAFGPVALTDPENDGRYDAALGSITVGNWLMTVRANEIPGGKSAIPLARTWNVTLQPGQPSELVKAGASGGSGNLETSFVPVALATAAGLGVALAAGARRGRRRRSITPAR